MMKHRGLEKNLYQHLDKFVNDVNTVLLKTHTIENQDKIQDFVNNAKIMIKQKLEECQKESKKPFPTTSISPRNYEAVNIGCDIGEIAI